MGIFKTGVIHSLGNLLVKLLLVWIAREQTHFLTKSENSLLGLLDALEQFVMAIMVLGQGQAFMREYKENADPAYRRLLKSTTFWLMIGVAVLTFILLQTVFKSLILSHLTPHPLAETAFLISCVWMLLRGLQSLSINFMRADAQAARLESLNFFGTLWYGIAVLIGFYWLQSGILTITVSRLFLFLPVLLFVMWLWMYQQDLRFQFDVRIAKKTLIYGLPLILAAAASPILNFADRFIMRELLGDDVQGVYDICYRFGMIPGMILVSPFLQIWQHAIYDHADETTRQTLYQRMLLYFAFAACMLWLGLSVCSLEMLQVIGVKETYWYGHTIIPWVAASQVFYGLGWVVVAGLAVQARTFFIGAWTAFAAVLNIALNWWWLPLFGINGAAYATTVSFVVIFLGFAFYAKRHLAISFPYPRFVLMIASVFLAWWLISPLRLENMWLTILLKCVLCLPVVAWIGFLANIQKLWNGMDTLKSKEPL